MLIDTHSHLYDKAFDPDRQQVVERAVAAGVGKIILPAIDSESHGRLLDLSAENPQVFYPLMGLHPTSVNDNPGWQTELDAVGNMLRGSASGKRAKFYGIGEVGMDLYWSKDFADRQEEVFRTQIEWSLELDLPLVIHTRQAWPQMRRIMEDYKKKGVRGVLHSFSGTFDDYRFFRAFENLFFGIGGPVTYKNSELARIIPSMDMGRIVLETDSPYLPPVPYRGQRNESSYLVRVCARVAELTGLTPQQVETVTTENARQVFGI